MIYNQKLRVCVMNKNKPQSEGNSDCSILSSYKSIQKETHRSPVSSNLQAVKLEILKKLIREGRCRAGHTLTTCYCE